MWKNYRNWAKGPICISFAGKSSASGGLCPLTRGLMPVDPTGGTAANTLTSNLGHVGCLWFSCSSFQTLRWVVIVFALFVRLYNCSRLTNTSQVFPQNFLNCKTNLMTGNKLKLTSFLHALTFVLWAANALVLRHIHTKSIYINCIVICSESTSIWSM